MEKTIFSTEYTVFLASLREARKKAGMTQEQLAKRLGETQSFISKCERGERRMDIIELMAFCRALGADFPAFVSRLQTRLSKRTDR